MSDTEYGFSDSDVAWDRRFREWDRLRHIRLGAHIRLANGKDYRVGAFQSRVATDDDIAELAAHPDDRIVTLTLVPAVVGKATP